MRFDVRKSVTEAQQGQIKSDALLNQLQDMSPQDAADWIEANVNSLADAKAVLKAMAKFVVYAVKRL